LRAAVFGANRLGVFGPQKISALPEAKVKRNKHGKNLHIARAENVLI
jgi:hypothetical protein